MEYFDVIDKDRKSLNKKLLRGSKLGDNEFNQGAEIWIANKNNEFLITQRSAKKSHSFLWECPGGCTISGENTFQTIKREISEEVGINLTNIEPIYLDTKLYKSQFVDIYFIKKYNLKLSDIKLQKEEVQNARFATIFNLEKMIKNNEVVQSVGERYYFIKDKLIKLCFEEKE